MNETTETFFLQGGIKKSADEKDNLFREMSAISKKLMLIPEGMDVAIKKKLKEEKERQDNLDAMKVLEIEVKQKLQVELDAEAKRTNQEWRDAETFKRLQTDNAYQSLRRENEVLDASIAGLNAELETLKYKFRSAEAHVELFKLWAELLR